MAADGTNTDEFAGYDWRSGQGLLKDCEELQIRPGRHIRVLRKAPASADGTTVLFVHGSAASLTQYLPILAALSEKRGFGFVAYDWLGCGGSAKPDGWEEYSTGELLEDLAEVWARYFSAQEGKKSFIVAHSFGTHLTLRLVWRLRQASKPVPAGLVLLAGAFRFQGCHPIFRLPVFCLNQMQPALTKGFLSIAFAPGCDQALLDDQEKACNENPMYMCKAYYRQMEMAPEEEIRGAAVPSLIVHGEFDGIVSLDGAKELANAALGEESGEVVTVPGTSHNLMLEAPGKVSKIIADFLS
eukprot:TRINITY_DN19975_c0_g1_i1.p1 TRINITY_DN19975_c0_g1~~TRINITY_DN19975_c0_g1_i1.p1  ORF type:complete len:311 (-),score=71.20 TRINITY_DN19975_c0_g1_i1:34-930(-)